jgi:hypothetical protein
MNNIVIKIRKTRSIGFVIGLGMLLMLGVLATQLPTIGAAMLLHPTIRSWDCG